MEHVILSQMTKFIHFFFNFYLPTFYHISPQKISQSTYVSKFSTGTIEPHTATPPYRWCTSGTALLLSRFTHKDLFAPKLNSKEPNLLLPGNVKVSVVCCRAVCKILVFTVGVWQVDKSYLCLCGSRSSSSPRGRNSRQCHGRTAATGITMENSLFVSQPSYLTTLVIHRQAITQPYNYLHQASRSTVENSLFVSQPSSEIITITLTTLANVVPTLHLLAKPHSTLDLHQETSTMIENSLFIQQPSSMIISTTLTTLVIVIATLHLTQPCTTYTRKQVSWLRTAW